jgi:hypothetical protein
VGVKKSEPRVARSPDNTNSRQLAHIESHLRDACALLPGAQNVRLRWDVALLPDSKRLVEETLSGRYVSIPDHGVGEKRRMYKLEGREQGADRPHSVDEQPEHDPRSLLQRRPV